MTQNNLGVSINKGSLVAALANAVPAELPVGTDGQILINDSGSAVGQTWVGIPPVGLPGFTPTIFGSAVSGTASYGARTCIYSLFGDVVVAHLQMDFSGFTGTGNIQMTLPVTVGASMSNFALGSCQFISTYTGLGNNIAMNASAGNAFVTFLTYGSAASATVQQCTATGNLRATIMYLKA
jgi:hypothetical protein